jgi:hypothetical protein
VSPISQTRAKKHLAASRQAEPSHATGHGVRVFLAQDRRKQQHVPRLSAAEVPRACVPAEPGGPDPLHQGAHLTQPDRIEILRLVQVHVQEVVGHRHRSASGSSPESVSTPISRKPAYSG